MNQYVNLSNGWASAAISDGKFSTVCAAPANPPLASLHDTQAGAIKELTAATERIAAVLDKLVSEPNTSGIGQCNAVPSRAGVLGSLQDQADRIASLAVRANSLASRLEGLA